MKKYALGWIGFLMTAPAFASHEGQYLVGQYAGQAGMFKKECTLVIGSERRESRMGTRFIYTFDVSGPGFSERFQSEETSVSIGLRSGTIGTSNGSTGMFGEVRALTITLDRSGAPTQLEVSKSGSFRSSTLLRCLSLKR